MINQAQPIDESNLDLVVVGAGPAGIAIVAEARAAGVPAHRIVVVEKAEVHSFTIRKYYPAGKPVLANYKGIEARCEGVLCIPDLSREETLTYLDRAIRDSGVDVRYRQEVYRIALQDDGRLVVETSGGTYRSLVVVVAIGILGRPNRLPAPVPRAVAKQVLYTVTDETLHGLDVLVVGGGDTAMEYVQYLCQERNRVTLSYRGHELNRPNPINRDSVLALESLGKVRIAWGTRVEALAEHEGRIHVKFQTLERPEGAAGATGAATIPSEVLVDRIVCALGGTTPEHFLKAIGIAFDGPDPILTDGFGTTVPGLYLAGDLTAGKSGGSIILAFNTAARAIRTICEAHGICELRSLA